MSVKTSVRTSESIKQVDGWRVTGGYRYVAVLGVGTGMVVHRITSRPCVRQAIDKAIATGAELVPTNNVNAANRCPECIRRLPA